VRNKYLQGCRIRPVQRQSFWSNLIYGGASSNWPSTTSTVAILGVALGGFVSRVEPAMMTTKAASPARTFIVPPLCRQSASRGCHTGHGRCMKPFTRRAPVRGGALRSDLPTGSDRGVAGGPVVFGAVPSQITVMPAHRFRVGQTVVALWSGPQVGIPLGPYVIVRLLPVEVGEPHYRVRSSVDGHERALLESQIRLREEKPAPVEAPSAKPVRRRR
jgi:hypothetical protein